MRLLLFFFLFIGFSLKGKTQVDTNHAVTYAEGINAFESFAESQRNATLYTFGETDIGKPLHVLALGEDIKSLSDLADPTKPCILINNAIHAGEACGTEASIQLFDWLMTHDLAKVNIAIIPFYNVSGVIHRSPYNRTDQFGPSEFGFRANYQNLDLNRDFVKMDSKNAASLVRLLHLIDPEIYLETHTTNGSEHQNVLGLLFAQYDKMEWPIREIAYHQLAPYLYQKAEEKGLKYSPYVYANPSPDKGIYAFYDLPRYSTGFVDVLNTIGLITEAHKYKSFPNRVEHTKSVMQDVIIFAAEHPKEILKAKSEADILIQNKSKYPVAWELDTNRQEIISFKGYESKKDTSRLTKKGFLSYDLSKPFERDIKYYKFMKPKVIAQKPTYYVLPQYQSTIIERLKINKVSFSILNRDTTFKGIMFKITDYQTVSSPYEKHYLHYNVKTDTIITKRQYFKGDILISTNQPAVRYIIETLDPRGKDSFFAWNFFDEVLQQKEYFSSFKFDETAEKLLANNPQLRTDFENWRGEDESNYPTHYQQLKWVYDRSPYHEKNHFIYPVMMIYK